MRILDRYIIQSIILIFITTVFIFCLLYVLIDSASNLDEFINRKVPLFIIGQYYLSYFPVILVQTSTVACLIACLFTYTTLGSHNEIVVLRSSGLNFWQIIKPALGFCFIMSSFIFLVNERLVPAAQNHSKRIKNEHMSLESDRQQKKMSKIKDLTFYGLNNRLYYISSFDPNTYESEGITIIGYDEKQNIKEKIVALNGKWTGIAWKFYQCHVTTFSESINAPTKVKVYQEKLIDTKETPETPQDFINQMINVNAMNIKQLFDYIKRFSKSGAKRAINNLKVDLYQKIFFPWETIVVTLVGLPIALTTGRRKAQSFTALGIATAIGFFYYVLNAVGLAFGKGGLLPPIVAATLAPVLFILLAFLLVKVRFS